MKAIKAAGIVSLAMVLLIAGLLSGCAKNDNILLGGQHGIKGEETKVLKESESITGLSPTYLLETRELFFERVSPDSAVNAIFVMKNGVERELVSNVTSPSPSKLGLFFISEAGVELIVDNKAQFLGLNNEYLSVVASPSGQKLVLVKPIEDGVNALYFYDVQMKRLEKINLPTELYPNNPSWVSESEIYFDAGVNFGGISDPEALPKNIYSLQVDDPNAKPELILSDHNSPALSPQGDLLACLENNLETSVVTLAVYETKTMKRLAFTKMVSSHSFFEAPITWLSKDRFAVTKVGSGPPGSTSIKVYRVEDKI